MSTSTKDVLIIDDEPDIRELISDILKDDGYSVRTSADSLSAFEAINDRVPSVIILDIWLQGSELDGLGILEIIQAKYPYLPVVVISGHGNIKTAVQSIKMGAYDYIEKPFTADKLTVVVKNAFEAAKLQRENNELKQKVKSDFELIGTSSAVVQLKSSIIKLANAQSRVWLFGDVGCEIETVARSIHLSSKRAKEPYVMFNPTGMTPEQAEIELFGGDDNVGINDQPRKIGALERANLGTLFIYEVADMPVQVQNKFLRFLQDQTFLRSGTNKKVKLDLRIISSSSKDIQQEIKANRFRQDLYYRLNVVPLKLPNLSERREDIPLLCNHYIKYLSDLSGLPARQISSDAMIALQSYKWPGNTMQLRNVMEWLLIMAHNSSDKPITLDMLPPEILSGTVSIMRSDNNSDVMSLPLREAREIFEKQYLTAQINRFNGNISRTSAFVGMERSALHRKLKSLNIHMAGNVESMEDQEVAVN